MLINTFEHGEFIRIDCDPEEFLDLLAGRILSNKSNGLTHYLFIIYEKESVYNFLLNAKTKDYIKEHTKGKVEIFSLGYLKPIPEKKEYKEYYNFIGDDKKINLIIESIWNDLEYEREELELNMPFSFHVCVDNGEIMVGSIKKHLLEKSYQQDYQQNNTVLTGILDEIDYICRLSEADHTKYIGNFKGEMLYNWKSYRHIIEVEMVKKIIGGIVEYFQRPL